jgi:uncharacterized protein with HEPN domain
MRPEARKFLFDIQRAAELITEFVKGKSREDFAKDPMLRSAVERQYEIIGEAIGGLARVDPGCAERIPEHRRIVAFRNILIHAYAKIDILVVWDATQTKLPELGRRVRELLQESESS